jgi:hypothetical protein
LPAWATHTEGAKTAYRFLLFFKFTPEEIAILKSNPDFQDAARKNDRDLQFARANPQIVKQVQNSTY